MKNTYNIYCDESCHLEHDASDVMALGAVWIPMDKKTEIFNQIKNLKNSHNMDEHFEVKWGKVSKGKLDFYKDLVNLFFNNEDMHFRGCVIKGKSKLAHKAFSQDHDTWYYKMYFHLLQPVLDPLSKYRVYLDIKDTKSAGKVRELHKVLCNANYDFSRDIIESIQNVHSHEVSVLQIADLFIGATAYLHRGLKSSTAKLELIEFIKQKSGYSLAASTLLKENKFNIFIWTPTEPVHE